MNQHNVRKFTTINLTTRKLLGALSLAVAISAVTPLVAAHAQEDRPGNDMAHQERNPSQHPELFSGPAATARSIEQSTTTTPVVPATRRNTTRRNQSRALFFVTPAVAATPVRRNTAPATDDAVGNDSAHQERNPSQHPELWVLSASR